MKNILLATTALVMSAGIASAELKFSGSARVGLKTTEATAAKTTAAKAGVISAAAKAAADLALRASAVANDTGNPITVTAGASTAGDIAKIKLGILNLETAIANDIAATGASTAANANDLATLQAVLAEVSGTAASTAAAAASTTQSINRVRVNFDASGETDSGLSFGASIRADNAAGGSAGTAGSQFISGAFGTISMGDVDGVDQIIDVAGVGVSGLGFTNEFVHNSEEHNLSWTYEINGLTLGVSTDTTNTGLHTGDNAAYAVSYAMDAGGAAVTAAAAASNVGNTTQTSYGLTIGMNGLTLKASTSTNDNGPAVALTNATPHVTATPQSYVAATSAVANNDTDQNAVSVSYKMDALTLTAYNMEVKTSGAATKEYTGFGVSYDLGGAKLVAGTVDANGTQVSDLGISFSF